MVHIGDRGNIIIKDAFNDAPVFLYSHWGGTDLPQVLAKSLDSKRGRGRWDDGPYLARIIFEDMILEGGALGEETGFGIATAAPDNGHDFLYVDIATNRVLVIGDTPLKLESQIPKIALSFEEFIDAVGQGKVSI